VSSDAGDLLSERNYKKALSVEKAINRSVVTRSAIDLCENGRRNAHQGSAFMSGD
jgi:hypothetical protein